MADLTVAAAVGRLNTAIAALSGWSVPPLPVSLLQDNARERAHKVAHAFADRTEVQSGAPAGRRQGPSVGARVKTRARVEYLWRLRADNYAADIASAYGGEAALIVALESVSLVDLHVTLIGTERTILGDRRHVLGAVLLDLTHSLALA